MLYSMENVYSLVQNRNINVLHFFLLVLPRDAMIVNATAAISSIQARYDRRSLIIQAPPQVAPFIGSTYVYYTHMRYVCICVITLQDCPMQISQFSTFLRN